MFKKNLVLITIYSNHMERMENYTRLYKLKQEEAH